VLQASSDERFAEEADLADVTARQELLDGDVAAELEVVCAGDATEAAAAVFPQNSIARRVAELRSHGNATGRGDARTAGALTGTRRIGRQRGRRGDL
jgi:hypothetical protein